jgi:hypothetical protein
MESTNPEPDAPDREPTVPNPEPPPPVSEPAAPLPVAPAPGSLANAGDAEAARAAARGAALRQLGLQDPLPLTVVREYIGKQQKDANSRFSEEAQQFAVIGYSVSSQSWAQGQWGCGAWLVALVCILFVGLGLLILAYMLIVKPAGTLTVTYTLKD